jgi:hypothetical protein
MSDLQKFYLLTAYFLGTACIVGGVYARAAQANGGLELSGFSVLGAISVLFNVALILWGLYKFSFLFAILGFMLPVATWFLTPDSFKISRHLRTYGLLCSVLGLVNVLLELYTALV